MLSLVFLDRCLRFFMIYLLFALSTAPNEMGERARFILLVIIIS